MSTIFEFFSAQMLHSSTRLLQEIFLSKIAFVITDFMKPQLLLTFFFNLKISIQIPISCILVISDR